MKKKSTTLISNLVTMTPEEESEEARKSIAGSPRKSTLSLIRQFARAYHYENCCGIPAGIILN